jgi:Protein of unknown function (DUF3224)
MSKGTGVDSAQQPDVPAQQRTRGHFGGERQERMSVSGEGAVRANAVITVDTYEPVAYEQPAEGPVLTRIHVQERLSGDLQGDGVVEFLQAARADGSASFVGIERCVD